MDTAQQIEMYRRQYFQLVNPQRLQLPHLDVLRLPKVQESLYNKMFSGNHVSYLPHERYRFRVLKGLIDSLQKAFQDPEEDEISDSLTSCFAQLAAQPSISEIDSAQQKSYVTYTAPTLDTDAPSVTTLEARSVLASSGNTGVRTWEAALRLGGYLFSATGRHHVTGMNVLELGAGTGFLSILCAKHLGARFVLATDGSGAVVDELQSNIILNEIKEAGSISGRVFRWGYTPVPEVLGGPEIGPYQLILGADITYDGQSIPALVSTLQELFARDEGIKALISATLRNEKTLDTFTNACTANRFHLERVQIPLVKEENQLGFFYPTSTPILVFMITGGKTSVDHGAMSSSEESL